MTRHRESIPDELVRLTDRPSGARARIELYPLVKTIQARFADMDFNAHLNNLALESMHEDMRAHLNVQAFPEAYDGTKVGVRIVSAQNVVHFLSESRWPAEVHAAVGVGRIGGSSYVAASALFVDGVCISVCDTLLVIVDGNGPAALPDTSRTSLEALMLRWRTIDERR